MKHFTHNDYPVKLHGLTKDFRRLPDGFHETLNHVAATLSSGFSAGGRVRFATDSKSIEVSVSLCPYERLGIFTLSGQAGCAVYLNNRYTKTYSPENDGDTKYRFVIENNEGYSEITILLPIYTTVRSMDIAIEDNAEIREAKDYKITKPVVFYGSSITNGVAASSPHNTFPERLSRKYGFDYYNYGFAGGCRGEVAVADHINKIDMTMLVYGYDHNASTAEELEERHQRFFKRIREVHPKLPVLILSKPDFANDPVNNALRRDVIYHTYSEAQREGDENVYFFDGSYAYGNLSIRESTADGIHPIDSTFEHFANILSPVFDLIFEKLEVK
ncbi:MAG: hypothetical protein E7591_01030 [Ruminococcaceae bacterium]|nr:hypothetical protein [Oscillospiraceae bacterium]